MRKKVLLLAVLCLWLLAVLPALAQEETAEPTLDQRFPTLRVKDQFNQTVNIKYYRFPQDTWFYEPLDLSYFPHEKWEKDEWSLLGRWKDGRTYNQMIYLDAPESEIVFHGTDIGQGYGYFADFYMYADLFVLDNYPQNTGSCYLYYSNSMMTGFDTGTGIMIDPQSGIYRATNSYGGDMFKIYDQYFISHEISQIIELNPADYAFSAADLEATSIGASAYPAADLNAQFTADYEFVSSQYRNPNASPMSVYRIEVVRDNGHSDVYINGFHAASFDDRIMRDGTPDNVSVSYGPMLWEGGLTVTCAIGDLYVYAK